MMLLLFWLAALFCADTATAAATACNPLTTNGCPAIPGLATSSYSIDFTQVNSLPKEWILADASDVRFGSNGAQFNFNKRKDAPYIWTNFYVAYGRIDVEMQVASGTGVVSSAVMFSDDSDEIDWEFSGSNFGAGANVGKIQTNVFGKGLTGNYDRGTVQDVSPPPQTSFHTYTINWTPDKIDWILDGNVVRTETNNGKRTGNYQFPQTPSRLHLGVWDAGDPDTPEGTRQWAGGYTDYSKCPYIAYVKTVKISTPYPCQAWKYPDNFSGSWVDVKCTNETLPNTSATIGSSASATTSSQKPKITDATYTVVANDNGYTIADKLGCTFDQLSAANPGVKWDFLEVGQKLRNPFATSSPTTSKSTSSAAKTMSTTATSTKPKNTAATYTVVAGDNGWIIADKLGCTFDELSKANPGIKWDFLNVGQKLINPNAATQGITSSSPSSTTFSYKVTVGAKPLTCPKDGCFNSMTVTQHITSAVSFCSDYKKTSTLKIPDFLKWCNGDAGRIYSACACLSSSWLVTSTNAKGTPSTWIRSATSSSISFVDNPIASNSPKSVPSTASTRASASLSKITAKSVTTPPKVWENFFRRSRSDSTDNSNQDSWKHLKRDNEPDYPKGPFQYGRIGGGRERL